MAFGIAAARAKEEQRIKANRRLREEQDMAYTAALQIDKVWILPLSILMK